MAKKKEEVVEIKAENLRAMHKAACQDFKDALEIGFPDFKFEEEIKWKVGDRFIWEQDGVARMITGHDGTSDYFVVKIDGEKTGFICNRSNNIKTLMKTYLGNSKKLAD